MGQRVPSWDVDEDRQPPTSTVYANSSAFPTAAAAARTSLHSHSNSTGVPDVSMLDYEVAELTWENGQLSMHGLGPPRSFPKPLTSVNNTTPSSKYTWPDNKPRTSGTLESIVNQATSALPNHHRNKIAAASTYVDDLIPWFDRHRTAAAAAAAAAATSASASATMTMDALVPCSNRSTTDHDQHTATTHVIDESNNSTPVSGFGKYMVGSSTRAGSCSGAVQDHEDGVNNFFRGKRAKVAPGAAVSAAAPEWSGREHSFSGSATFGRESQRVTLDNTCERDLGVNGNFTSTSQGSLGNTTSGGGRTGVRATGAADDHDSVGHSRPHMEEADEDVKKKGTGKSSLSTKRSRAAAIHNQSERKRRDKINQRMKTLQKLVPNSSKTDKASMLDEVIDYLKQLQAQVQMISRMNIPAAMMLPMAMQQQLQMSMMAPAMGLGMGMGPMGMGMGMDPMNAMGRPNIAGLSPVLHPSVTAFMPLASSWDSGNPIDRIQPSPAALMTDPLSAFLTCQSQPTTMDAYRMAALYQQLHPGSNPKN